MESSTIALWVAVAIVGLITLIVLFLAFMTIYYRVKYNTEYTVWGVPITWGHGYYDMHHW
jgi:beta-lactamase regulating signal transducer with metallopeptidase domain